MEPFAQERLSSSRSIGEMLYFGVKIRHSLRVFAALALVSLLGACKQEPKSDETKIQQLDIELLQLVQRSYDSERENLFISGIVRTDFSSDPAAKLYIYGNNQCAFPEIVETHPSAFGNGLEIQVSSITPTPLFARTMSEKNGLSDCIGLIEYIPQHDPPSVPVFTSYSPPSPSNQALAPRVLAQISGNTLWVDLFSSADCSGPALVSQASRQMVAVAGLEFPALTEDGTRALSIRAYDPFGTESPCAPLPSYIHDRTNPPTPTFASLTPTSPTRLSAPPVLKVQRQTDTVSFQVFDRPDCTMPIATAQAEQGWTSGITAPVPRNAETALYVLALDQAGNRSTCAPIGTFRHDNIPPNPPTFLATDPLSPSTRDTDAKVSGRAPVDALVIRFFDSECVESQQIGQGSRSDFENQGIPVQLRRNSTLAIHAQTVDEAGNASACTLMTFFRSDGIAPEPPELSSVFPNSPTNSMLRPVVKGVPPYDSVSIELYGDDESCSDPSKKLGEGPASTFGVKGITINSDSVFEKNTKIFAKAFDAAGNASVCSELTTYNHSTVTPPAPVFLRASPNSPSSFSTNPAIQGSTEIDVEEIRLYKDSCDGTPLGSGSRMTFFSGGIRVQVERNQTTAIYGNLTDLFGNISNCVFLTSFTHDDIPPARPAFISTTPPSPTKETASPQLRVSTSEDTVEVRVFSTRSCSYAIASRKNNFNSDGFVVPLAENTLNEIWARSYDLAGNASDCTRMTEYLHDTIPPENPTFFQPSPRSPSFVDLTRISGWVVPDGARVEIHKNSSCTDLVSSGSRDQFLSGIQTAPPQNTITNFYGHALDLLGNASDCVSVGVPFIHRNTAPGGLEATPLSNGVISLRWDYDPHATSYVIRRSLRPGGPYTTLSDSLTNPDFADEDTRNGGVYYYTIASSNHSGTTLNAPEITASVNVTRPPAPGWINVTPGDREATLSWGAVTEGRSYSVWRAEKTGGPYVKLASSLRRTAYEDRNLTNLGSYFYVVTAENPAGSSSYSPETSTSPRSLPEAPTGLTADLVAEGVQLRWSPSSSHQKFRIYRSDYLESGYILLDSGSTDSFLDTTASQSRTGRAYYRVSPIWGSSLSTPSGQVAVDLTRPVLSAEPGNERVILRAVMGSDRYYSLRIYRSLAPEGPWTELDTPNISAGGNNLTTTDLSLNNETAYYYRIRGVAADLESAWSNVANATPRALPTSGPQNLVVKTLEKSVRLSWVGSPYAAYYRIYRATIGGGSTGSFLLLADRVGNNFHSYTPTSDGLYVYYVTAVWGEQELPGAANRSNEVQHRYAAGPASLTATPITATPEQIRLAWSKVLNSSGYSIWRSQKTSAPEDFEKIADIGDPNTLLYTDNTPSALKHFRYKVIATFPGGTISLESPIASAQTGSSKPEGFEVTKITASSVGLKWIQVPGISRYRIRGRVTDGGTYNMDPKVIPSGSQLTYSTATTWTRPSSFNGAKVVSLIVSAVSGTTTNPVESAPSVELRVGLFDQLPAPTVTQTQQQALRVSWNHSSDAIKYKIFRSVSGAAYQQVFGDHEFTSEQGKPADLTCRREQGSGRDELQCVDSNVNSTQLYEYQVQPIYSASGGTTITGLLSTESDPKSPRAAPFSPMGLAVSQVTADSIQVSWSAVPVATAYTLKTCTGVCTNSDSVYTKKTTVTNQTSAWLGSFTNPGSPPRIFIKISASIDDLESSDSSPVMGVLMAPPDAPQVTADGKDVTITWSTVTTATSYDLLRSADGVDFQGIASNLSPSEGASFITYVDQQAPAGARLVYKYLPRFAGPAIGALSLGSRPITPDIRPLQPTALVARRAATESRVALSWIPSPNAEYYRVYRSRSSEDPTLIGTSTVASFLDESINTQLDSIYTYFVRAINESDVASEASNHASIQFTATQGPIDLSADNPNHLVRLDWTALNGATSYRVYRSESANGPFAVLQTGIQATTFSDTQIQNGRIYYYSVAGEDAQGTPAQASNVVSIIAKSVLDLEVPIEMIDRALASSSSGDMAFTRSATRLDTNDYDGETSYSLEAVLENRDTSARSIRLLNLNDDEVALITIQPGVIQPQRMAVTDLPVTPGRDQYRIKLDRTSDGGQLVVHSARIRVRQRGASKTNLYFPLGNSFDAPSNLDNAPIAQATGGSPLSLEGLSRYVHRPDDFTGIAEYFPFTFTAMVGGPDGSSGTIALRNATNNQVVPGSAFSFSVSSGNILEIIAPIASGLSGLGGSGPQANHDVSVTCSEGCQQGISVYKVGVWLRLENFTKAAVFFRSAAARNLLTTEHAMVTHQIFLDPQNFTNPRFVLQALWSPSVSASSALTLNRASDLSPISGASLDLNTLSTSQVQLSASSPFNVDGPGELLVVASPNISNSAPAIRLRDAGVWIRLSKPADP